MPTYHASCHCGDVRLAVHKDEPVRHLTDCNCSLCVKKGILHLAVEDSELTFLAGEDKLALYQWRTNTAKHWFCPNCGIHVLNRPRSHPERYSVNARCVDGFEALLATVELRPYDGRDHPKDREG